MVNFKQMIGLIILSIGMILMIYSLRAGVYLNGTLIAGIVLFVAGTILSLVMNKQKNK